VTVLSKTTATLTMASLLMMVTPMTFATAAAAQGHDRRPAKPSRLSEQLIELRLRQGETQKVLLVTPPHARAAIVMLPGGAGDVGLSGSADIRHSDNFVVRTRALWARRGFTDLIPDTIGHANLRGIRSSPGYASVVNDLVELAHRQVTGPVFLLGTSQGSIAAVNAAAHATAGSIAGVVLTESVSVMGGSGETVFSASPKLVRAPALIVANRDDRCNVAPPEAASKIARTMTMSRDVQVLMVAGGSNRSAKNCGSLTPHGYYGIEDQVIAKISRWMDAHGG
jgi:alpha-beta hydrolase superfamily lysophospholipase